MRILVSLTCIALLAAIGMYFYRDHQAGVAAERRAEEQKIRSACYETQEGREWSDMKAMNKYCREQGYID